MAETFIRYGTELNCPACGKTFIFNELELFSEDETVGIRCPHCDKVIIRVPAKEGL